MWQISRDSTSRIENWSVGGRGQAGLFFFGWLGRSTCDCVSGAGGYVWQRLESRKQAISMRRVTGRPGLTGEGGA